MSTIFVYDFFSHFFLAQEALLGAQCHQDHPGPAREPTPGKAFIYLFIYFPPLASYLFIYFACMYLFFI